MATLAGTPSEQPNAAEGAAPEGGTDSDVTANRGDQGSTRETQGAGGAEPAMAAPPAVAPDAAGSTISASAERMARLRHLVRKEGMDSAAAAHEVGVDPVVAQLWLRLPDDLWPDAAASGPGSRAASAVGAAPHPPSEEQGPRPTDPRPPTPGLRRVLTCRIPFPAFDRLRAAGQPGGPLEAAPLLEAAVAALETGLKLERPPVAPGGWHFPRRPLAVPLPGEAYAAIVTLAQEAFAGDLRDAAGWVIARGVGMALPLPTPEELAGVAKPREPVLSERPFLASSAASPNARFFIPPRRRPEPRAPLPPDDSAPSGDELRRRREAIGVSQRDLAAASGLSRGLVAEVERGRRRHVLTRLRLAETLASLALRQ